MEKLTVNILTYNGASAFLQHTLESIIPYAEEVLVFDTGSTDDTLEILKHYPVTVYQEDVQFLGETWTHSKKDVKLTQLLNKMKNESSGDYILKVDDDEIFPPDLMEEIMKTEKEEPIYSIPFYHIGGIGKFIPIKRLFKNIPEVTWNGIYGTETLAYNNKRLSSKACPTFENYFIHLGELRKDFLDRKHKYGNL